MNRSRLDPRLAKWLENYNRKRERLKKRLGTAAKETVESSRQGVEILSRGLAGDFVSVPAITDAELALPDRVIPVRSYHPEPGKSLPILLYFHGGGHIAGSIASHDPICRRLARATHHQVLSVGYRLAPEHPYPAGLDDCRQVFDKLEVLLENMGVGFGGRVILGGDSAGASLAIHLAASGSIGSRAVAGLVLFYPGLDYSREMAARSEFATGYLLELDQLRFYMDQTFEPGVDRRNLSPLHMDQARRARLPRTFLLTCGCCPLLDEGLLFANRLLKAGVELTHHHEPGMIHGFLGMHSLVADCCDRVYRRVARFLHPG